MGCHGNALFLMCFDRENVQRENGSGKGIGLLPVKAEIKAVVSGIYITSIKNLRNVAPPEPEKRGLRAKLTKKSAEFMRKN